MFLDRIVADKQKEVERLKATMSVAGAEKAIAALPPARGFEDALARRRKRPLGLIAEVKKASPSKGLIRSDFDPVQLAKAYAEAGADCISVLTDAPHFQGSPEHLRRVREVVDLPLLRKDFIIDERQIYETRLLGADAVLLIAAILTRAQLSSFHDLARSVGLDVLVEVHDRAELETVLEIGKATLIGVNNRNLRTFATDLKVTEELVPLMPPQVTAVSESAISAPEDIARVRQAGAKAVLIGEHFMRQPDVGAAVHALLGPVGQTGSEGKAESAEKAGSGG